MRRFCTMAPPKPSGRRRSEVVLPTSGSVRAGAMPVFRVLCLTAVTVLALCSQAASQAQADEVPDNDDQRAWIEYYDQRYALDDVFEKRTDNQGEGCEDLYGTRNFRVILKGVAYRGGANNKWHRSDRRDNRNPLPNDGLENLCEEGFRRAYYLYSTNFEVAPEVVTCEFPQDTEHELRYFQMSSTDEIQTYAVLEAISETIENPRRGPIYLHCWNGWHASGLIAAKILRQFCGYSADEAVQYWDRNTDGNNLEARYESIRRRIREFKPYPEFEIGDDMAALICP